MNYKIAMIDLDGTLLHNRTSISKTNLEALKKYSEKGGEIIISTGRWPISSLSFNNTIENFINKKNKYLITLNGSLIYQLSDNSIIFDQPINSDAFEKLIECQKKFGTTMWIYSKEGIENKLIHTINMPFKWLISKFNFGKIVNYKNEKLTPYKILFISLDINTISNVYEWLNQNLYDEFTIIRTSKKAIEVTHKGVDKGSALEIIAKKESINNNEIVCFGDSGNDVSMFEKAGFKVCLDQNNKELSKMANIITNHKNGVSYGINKYLFEKIEFDNQKVLNLDFSRVPFSVIDQSEFVKHLCFWNFINQNCPLSIVSKFSLNDNLMMFQSILNLNKNLLISCSDGTIIYNAKTKRIYKKSIISETQLVLLSSFLLKSLNNNDVSIIINSTSGSNLFLTKNPNNFINFLKDKDFDEDNFTVIDDNFEKYLAPQTSKYANIIIIGIDRIPKNINTNSFKIEIRGNVVAISNSNNFKEDYHSILNDYFGTKEIETVDIYSIISSQKQIFNSINDFVKEKFIKD